MIIGQIIGVIALIISLYALTHPSDRKLLKWFFFGNMLWILHYVLIDANVMAEFMTLALMRSFVAWQHKESKTTKLIALGLVVIIGLFIVIKNNFNILVIGTYTTTMLISYSVLYLKGKAMRYVFVFCDFLWLLLDLNYKSIGGIIYDLSAIYITLKIIRDFDISNKK